MQKMKVTCIGLGTIGASWALLFAQHGYTVSAYDLKDDIIETSKKNVRDHLDILIKNGVMDEGAATEIIERIHYTTSLEEALKDAEFA